ncbi:MAG: hypothetical protein E3J65_06950 [Dehalococcoidia bacterium]|nr:MAG: hypothetical protein E3J65_06950 [Dehalococcoidia bacterium]
MTDFWETPVGAFASNFGAEIIGVLLGALLTYLIINKVLERREEKHWSPIRKQIATSIRRKLSTWLHSDLAEICPKYAEGLKEILLKNRLDVSFDSEGIKKLGLQFYDIERSLEEFGVKSLNDLQPSDLSVDALVLTKILRRVPERLDSLKEFKSEMQLAGLVTPETLERLYELEWQWQRIDQAFDMFNIRDVLLGKDRFMEERDWFEDWFNKNAVPFITTWLGLACKANMAMIIHLRQICEQKVSE